MATGKLVNITAESNAEIIDNDAQPTLRLTNLGTGAALTVNSLVVTGTASISTAQIATEDAAITTTTLKASTLALTSTCSIDGALYAGGGVAATGEVSGDALAFTSVCSINTLNVGDLTLSVVDGDTLAITSTASVVGPLYMEGSSDFIGLADFDSLTIGSVVSMAGPIYSGDLIVGGNLSSDTLAITSVASITGVLNLEDALLANGGINIDGAVVGDTMIMASQASIVGAVNLGDTLTVSSLLTANGGVLIDGPLTGDTLLMASTASIVGKTILGDTLLMKKAADPTADLTAPSMAFYLDLGDEDNPDLDLVAKNSAGSIFAVKVADLAIT